MILRLFFLLVFCPLFVPAQDSTLLSKSATSKHKHNIILFGTGIQHFNSRDVETWGDKKFLTVKNTLGYRVGLGYEYVTKYNLSFGVSAASGIVVTDMTWNINFKNFDPEADFGDYSYVYHFYHRVPYMAVNLSVGYEYKPMKRSKLKVFAKLNRTNMFFFKGREEDFGQALIYSKNNDPSIHYIRKFAILNPRSGTYNPWYRQNTPIYSASAGVSHPLDIFIIKEARLSIDYTWGFKYGFGTSSGYYFNSAAEQIGVENYHERFRMLGITAGLVF